MKKIINKKATFNYEILDTYTAGIDLLGIEVKSIKTHNVSFEGSFVIIKDNEVFLKKLHISPYQENNTPESYDPLRLRKLILTRKEIDEMQKKLNQRGLTVVPLSMYNKGRFLKVDIAIVRGKKQHDKRNSLKDRDAKRDIARTLKNQY
jgi:SsrA-binding protein